MAPMKKLPAIVATALLLAVVAQVYRTAAAATTVSGEVVLTALSTDPALVTGGDVLLQVEVPPGTPRGDLRVVANSRDVTDAFQLTKRGDSFVGVVRDLPLGTSNIEATVGRLESTLRVTNYPITGPVVSGPWQQPFICQTDQFVLPDGSKLGPPLDTNCSARTVVQYIYKPTVGDPAKPFKPLADPLSLPPDVSKTTTVSGETVNYNVRV
jgi:hypothetical protein